MTGTHEARPAGRRDCVAAFCRGAADRVCLAAAPTFAVMALVTGLSGDGPQQLCSASPGASALGMVGMYLLMSAFHLTPWLKLIAVRWASR